MNGRAKLLKDTAGTAQVEETALIVLVAIGFAAACVPLGSLLLDYFNGIEIVLSLPIP